MRFYIMYKIVIWVMISWRPWWGRSEVRIGHRFFNFFFSSYPPSWFRTIRHDIFCTPRHEIITGVMILHQPEQLGCMNENDSWLLDKTDSWPIVQNHDGGNKISWRKKMDFMTPWVIHDGEFFHDESLILWRTKKRLITKCAKSWRREQNFMTEK